MRAVTSDAIEGVDHDGDALIIQFRGGRQYRYPTAGAEHADAIVSADSAGRYFHEHIRGMHDHEVERRGAAASFVRPLK